jgi:hypothetical protein
MPKDIRLLKTLQNGVLDRVRASGIAPTEFEWETVAIKEQARGYQASFTASRLVHVPSGFYYQFGAFNHEFSPGHLERVGREGITTGIQRHDRLQHVTYWLRELKEQLDAPDLWAEILQERRLSQIVSSSAGFTNTPFSQGEKEYVIQQLNEIKRNLISQHQLALKQTKAVEQGFQNIADAMNRLDKKDWIGYAVGTIVTIVVGAAFSPQVANTMFHSFMRAVGPLFEEAMKLIP